MATKLLIVDDEPLTVDMLQTFLQINGYETVGVYTGEEGLIMISIEQPDIMILDLMLPDIEGYEVCRRLRQEPELAEFASMPVLVLSARTESGARRKALDAGANVFMTKPPRFPELLSELDRLLFEKRMRMMQADANSDGNGAGDSNAAS